MSTWNLPPGVSTNDPHVNPPDDELQAELEAQSDELVNDPEWKQGHADGLAGKSRSDVDYRNKSDAYRDGYEVGDCDREVAIDEARDEGVYAPDEEDEQ